MRIDINFQSLAKKLKYKVISNSLRKRKKRIPPAAHHCVARADTTQHEAAHNGEALARVTLMQKCP